MNCQKARQLIQQRLDESPGAERGRMGNAHQESESSGKRDWTDLDAHLAACKECATEWEELQRTRALLQSVATDKPTTEEKETMWNAIAVAAPGGRGVVTRLGGRRAILEFAAASVGIAAVLMIALQVGHARFGGKPFWQTAIAQLPHMSLRSNETIFDTVKARAGSEWRPVGNTRLELRLPESEDVPNYVGADAVSSRMAEMSPMPTGSEVEEFRNLVSSREVNARGYICPSSSDDEQIEHDLDMGASRSMADSPSTFVGNGLLLGNASPVGGRKAKGYDLSGVDIDGDGVGDMSALPENPRQYSDGRSLHAADVPAIGMLSEPSEDSVFLPGILSPPAGSAPQKSPLEVQSVPPELVVAGQRATPTALGREIPEPRNVVESASRPQAKIIKTGNVTVEVDSYEQAMDRAKAIADQHGAFVADVSTREQTGGALAGHIVIRVSPERFEKLFDALKTLGRVETENVKAADVTAEYVDLEARIKGLEITEKRLAELIANKSFVDKVSSLLEVEREMNRVRSQIEQLTGQLRVMADRVALSTITLTLREPDRTVPSGSLSVEVPTVAEAAKSLGATLADLGGRLISGETSKRDDGTLLGEYQLQISVSRFDELLAAIEAFGRVEQRQVNDLQFDIASAAWATDAKCNLALTLFERSRQLPSGSLRFEVDQLPSALTTLTTRATEHQGSIVSNQTTRQSDGSSVAQLQIRVPCGEFTTLVDAIAPVGRATGKEISGEAGPIVGGAASSVCTLSVAMGERARQVPKGYMTVEVAKFDTARDQLSALVAEKGAQVLTSNSKQRNDSSWEGVFRLGIKTSEMETVVRCLESLGRVTSREIAGLGLGDLSQADPNAIGAIALTLAEKPTISPAPERAGGSIRKHLRDALAGVYSSLGLIAYGLIVIAPWLALVFIPAWLITRVRRRRQAAATEPASS